MIDPTILHVALLALVVIFGVLAVELKRLDHAIIAFAAMNVVLGVIFYLLYAPWVAVFQWLIYAGAVVVLFLVTVNLTREARESE
ncbi:MAG: NADH-quinone oxidoreductase subunit J [Candidatus Freyarchaeota archaeon]|nr:NADH-quinone oxidoreductase subunit J [Candidatus Freyarchaeota archaeon]